MMSAADLGEGEHYGRENLPVPCFLPTPSVFLMYSYNISSGLDKINQKNHDEENWE